MGIFKFFRRKKNKPLPMHPGNILVVASSPKEFDDFIKATAKVGYVENSDIFRLDSGDFSVVLKKRGS